MSDRRIILCADDYGISPAVSAAIRDLIARRRINATSVMVAAPQFDRDEAAKLLHAAAKHAAVGLHVTLTAPFAPLSQNFEPLRHGAFLSLATTLRRAHLRALRPKLLTVEISRQFEASLPPLAGRRISSTATITCIYFRKSAMPCCA